MRILFLCTGNECRSPVAERLAMSAARASLDGSPELASVVVLSAGLNATPGRPIDARSASALEHLGGDASDFRSSRFSSALAESADLVFTMTRDQRSAVLARVPRGLRRTFTLAEAAHLAARADLGGLMLLPLDERAREFGRRLDAKRSTRQAGRKDDIADPIGQRPGVHESVAGQIAAALKPLTAVLFTSIRPRLAVPVSA